MRDDPHAHQPDPVDGAESDEAFAARIAAPLRALERTAPDFTHRVMRAVRAESNASAEAVPRPRGTPWWRRRLTISLSLSPLGALAAAAAIAIVALLGRDVAKRSSSPTVQRVAALTPADTPHVATAARTDTVHVVRFVLLAPNAQSVALVGDFNSWQRGATPLRRTGADGLWTATVRIPPGAHQYAFIVNGTRWVPDPSAPTTVSDDFGTTTSVITVGGAAS